MRLISKPSSNRVCATERQKHVPQFVEREGEIALLLRVAGIGLEQLATDFQAVLKLRERVARATERQEDVPQFAEQDGEIALLLRVAGIGLGQQKSDSLVFLIVA